MIQLFYTFGANPSEDEKAEIKKEMKQGTISDIMNLFSNEKLFRKETEENVREYLETFDREKNGMIDINFLKHCI